MDRIQIINTIGQGYHSHNIENGEFSYVKAFKKDGRDMPPKTDDGTKHQFLDIRFENDRLAVLVETKGKFSSWNKDDIQKQLQEYVRLEKGYSGKKIVAILAETDGDEVWTWYGQSVIIDDAHKTDKTKLLAFEEYEELCFGKVNNKIKVVDSIKALNEKLHSDGIPEKLRSQFVGTCMLALKNGLAYRDIPKSINNEGNDISPEKQVLQNIKTILEGLLTNSGGLNKAGKLAILNNKVLEDQNITNLTYKELKDVLCYIDENIIPYINDKNTAGQDLLNLFFTTFNKYVGKSDKNQAFTPDHICDFMSKAAGVGSHSRVLDPCCGSGTFLVRAMTDAMDDCDTEDERKNVKKSRYTALNTKTAHSGLPRRTCLSMATATPTSCRTQCSTGAAG